MVVPRTPPTTARRHRRQPESTDPSSDIGSSASSVISEEMDTPTAPRAQSSTTANTMASTPDITALFQQMQEQMQEQMQKQMQEQMQKQMDQFMTRFNALERRQSQSSTPTVRHNATPYNHIQNNTAIPASNPVQKDPFDHVQAQVKALLPDRCRITLSHDNYDPWSSAIQREANVLNASTVLHQDIPPAGYSAYDAEVWHCKATVMRARMLHAMTAQAVDKLGNIYDLSAHGLWDRTATFFGRSTGEERMLLIKELKELYIKDNDYLSYQSAFTRIVDRLHAIKEASFDNLIHDLFFIGLREWNKSIH
ncbi:hypothetical protein MAP00_000061 [Monascus purpureus]|nr:hypothetical protein MAP00_000061 [Monascus purpureus]